MEDLNKQLAEAERELCEFRFQLASHQMKQVRKVRALKKSIANLRRQLAAK